MHFRTALIATLTLALLSSPAPLQAAKATELKKPDLAIEAVVGQEAISTYDVENRLKFVIVSSRLSNSQETISRLRPQVLRALIDEHIELAEARKNNIEISDAEVNAAIAEIESSRGLPSGAVFNMMDQNRIPRETFTTQIRSQLAWRKFVLKRLRPSVRVSDEEIRTASQIPVPTARPQELKIAVLMLPVDKPSRAAEVANTSRKLAMELRGGASFEEISRQLSSASTASPAPFWVRTEQLDPMLSRALATASEGTITDPIPTEAGYVIVKVYEARMNESLAPKDNEVVIKEIVLKLKEEAPKQEADALLSIGEAVAKHPGSCEDESVAGIPAPKDVNIAINKRREMVSTLPAGIRTIVENLAVGAISPPFASDDGIRLYMLCERQEKEGTQLADKDAIRNQLFQQKLELEAQKYLRNLRRETFIELRNN